MRIDSIAVFCVLPLLAGALAGTVAVAQSPIPISVEARAMAAVPTGSLADHSDPALGVGFSATVQLFPNYGLYAGWSRTAFGLEQEGRDARAIDSGFAIGLTASYPGIVGVTPWLGSGLLIHDLEVEGATAPVGDSSIGFEVGGGLSVPIAPRLRLTPGVGFRWYNAPLGADASARISYFSAGVGLNLSF
jgi:hypothetical protein